MKSSFSSVNGHSSKVSLTTFSKNRSLSVQLKSAKVLVVIKPLLRAFHDNFELLSIADCFRDVADDETRPINEVEYDYKAAMEQLLDWGEYHRVKVDV